VKRKARPAYLLELEGVSHVFPTPAGPRPALERIRLRIRGGEFVCLVGPSGGGKTTLLRLIAGLVQPTRGEIRFEGEPLVRPRRRIGFVFQQANLMPWRSVEENIRLPLEVNSGVGRSAARQVAQLVELVGLRGFERAYPADLSGGMAQRVALARALVHEPELLLLDEPFGSLDALTREQMQAELLRIWSQRPVTVLMVTHSIPEAVLLSDRVLVLSARPGRILLDQRVPLPRPRALEMAYSRAFGALAGRVRAAIADGG
jgi:NitT/TauT family transport system ATP-binding protein